jgi:hypothetical protein
MLAPYSSQSIQSVARDNRMIASLRFPASSHQVAGSGGARDSIPTSFTKPPQPSEFPAFPTGGFAPVFELFESKNTDRGGAGCHRSVSQLSKCCNDWGSGRGPASMAYFYGPFLCSFSMHNFNR